MKKYIIAIMVMCMSAPLFAQLQAPTETVRDTLYVVSMKYNRTTVSQQDWICDMFYETPTKIYIAGQIYEKGNAKGFDNDLEFPDATVNGNPAILERATSVMGVVTYRIDGYEIVTKKSRNNNTQVNTVSASMGSSVNLQGRNVIGSISRPSYSGKNSGTVVVSIWVDQYGNVTKAQAGAAGTTTSDKDLWNAARKAAIGVHFNQKADAPALQEGTITYIFTMK